jgi:hypothetical protein
MRYQAFILAALLASATTGAFAASPVDVLRQQRLKINHAIDERNALLDRIHFVGFNDDSVQLASINASELTVAYALQALESVVELDRSSAQQPNNDRNRGLRPVGQSMLMVCQFQLSQMDSDSAELKDSRIRDEVQKQIENVRAACGAITAATN